MIYLMVIYLTKNQFFLSIKKQNDLNSKKKKKERKKERKKEEKRREEKEKEKKVTTNRKESFPKRKVAINGKTAGELVSFVSPSTTRRDAISRQQPAAVEFLLGFCSCSCSCSRFLFLFLFCPHISIDSKEKAKKRELLNEKRFSMEALGTSADPPLQPPTSGELVLLPFVYVFLLPAFPCLLSHPFLVERCCVQVLGVAMESSPLWVLGLALVSP
jgi:hypothetical protein